MHVAAHAFTKSAMIYTIGTAIVVPIGIVSLAITTRYLSVSDYGRLSTLLAIGAMVTVIAGIGVLQGVLMAVYGAGDDDDDGGDDIAAEDFGYQPLTGKVEEVAAERRRLLGSGLLIIVLVSTAWCLLAAALAPLLATLFLGSEKWLGPMLWVAVVGWTGSIWRFAHQVWRLERRAVHWSIFQMIRALGVLVGSVIALVLGFGITGVLVGTAAGSAVATVISLYASRGSFVFRPRRGDAKLIIGLGLRVAPIVIARVSQANAAVLVLSLMATSTSVGLFQAAYRVAQIPSFFANGFMIGWIPLTKSPIGTAGYELRGRAGFGARIFTLLMLTLIGLTALISLGSGVAIHIAAPSFESAAGLIPVVAVGLVAMESFHAYYRASSFPNRRWWYTGLHFAWLAPYAVGVWLLKPLGSGYAVAAAQIVASGVVLVIFVWRDRLGDETLPVPWWRLAGVTSVATACVAAAEIADASDGVRAALGLVGILGFPIVLRLTGLISRGEQHVATSLVAALVPKRVSGREVRRRLGRLRRPEREALTAVGWDRQPPEDVAARVGAPPQLVRARMVRGLRAFSGYAAEGTPNDEGIGRYLLCRGGAIERDLIADELAAAGASLVELHELDDAMQSFKRMRRRGRRVETDAWGDGGFVVAEPRPLT